MGRLHLFEIEDLAWFPSTLRDLETELLGFVLTRFRVYDDTAAQLAGCLSRADEARVLDLCSGAGGPWPTLVDRLAAEHGEAVAVTLTDKFPNLPAMKRLGKLSEGRIGYVSEPVEATDVPEELRGVRTMYTSFHHFRPAEARKILRHAFDRREPICAFEFTARTPIDLLMTTLIPEFALLLTPFVRPFRLSRFLFTYVLPVIPLANGWDAFVSCLRTYSPSELRALVADLQAEDYRWEIGRGRKWWGVPITYLVGCPDHG